MKQRALAWAEAEGFAIRALEVSVPRLGCCRMDAAAARTLPTARGGLPVPPETAVFECKQSRADFLRDARCEQTIRARLVRLQELVLIYEDSMRLHFPWLRTGEGLFAEFDRYRFAEAGFEPYEKLRREIAQLTCRLQEQTKLARLVRWQAANLCYLVAEPGVVKPPELPAGWGLLVRRGERTEVAVPAPWHHVRERNRWELLKRILRVRPAAEAEQQLAVSGGFAAEEVQLFPDVIWSVPVRPLPLPTQAPAAQFAPKPL